MAEPGARGLGRVVPAPPRTPGRTPRPRSPGGATAALSLGGVRTIRLRITLRDVAPSVVRVVDVPAAVTLAGAARRCCRSRWDGPTATCTSSSPGTPATACPIRSSTPTSATRPAVDWPISPPGSATSTTSATAGPTTSRSSDPGEAQPGCGYGEGRCPPEDCGGPTGYAELARGAGRSDPRRSRRDADLGRRVARVRPGGAPTGWSATCRRAGAAQRRAAVWV